MWAVLPVKDLGNAKTRLAPSLSLAERAQLCLCMVQDVMTAVSAVSAITGLLVVTRDRQVAQFVENLGARVLDEAPTDGHSGAVRRAAHWLFRRGESGILAIPGDIPTVAPAELSRFVASHNREHGVNGAITIAPSRDRDGTNCILGTPPDLTPFLFGKDSFRRHIAAAHGLGMGVQIVEEPGIALDIDDPHDLAELAGMPGNTRTHSFLVTSGISRRVGCVTPRDHKMIV